MNFSKFKIGTRLYGGFGAVGALMVVLLVVASMNFAKLREANRMNVHSYEVLEETTAMLLALVNIETGQRGFALTGADASLEPYKAGKASFSTHWDKAKALTADNPKQQERLARLAAAERQWITEAVDPAIALRREIAAGSAELQAAADLETQAKGRTLMDSMRAVLAEIDKEERSLLAGREAEAQALERQTGGTIVVGGGIALALAALLAVMLTRNITRPLGQAVELAQRVARGDLTRAESSDAADETGQLINALKDMNDNLARIVAEVRGGTDQIASASSQIASGNMDLSSRTEEQASSLEETASSMEELTSTVQQNADNAVQANQLAASASDIALKGGAVVAQVVGTMDAINASSRKIVDIISVIDGIAFQTNILALNAAVEAARAGEQGRGFAVVASEVRNLAQRSAAAAKEIKELIGDSVDKVDSGSKLVNQAGATMEEVVQSVQRVSEIVREIAEASAEQRNGIEQVNQAISQMDNVTQQNASLVEEAAAAAGAMQEQAANLSAMVSVFKLDPALQAPPAIRRKPKLALVSPVVNTAAVQEPPPARPAQPKARAAGAARQPAKVADDWEEF
jgi:methyl-accepting chemotaxis protein